MSVPNHYATLGVSEDAGQDEIKRAYRKLAGELHPDRNPGDAEAEQKFKLINAAYEVLKNPEKKQQYDQMRRFSDPFMHARRFDFGDVRFDRRHFDMEDFLRDAAQRGWTSHRPVKNRDISVVYQISLEDAFFGKECEIQYVVPGEGRKSARIKIPPGVETGNKIRYAGAGDTSLHELAPGDLYVVLQVQPHSTFNRSGADLVAQIQIDAIDAMVGSELDMAVIDGGTVRVTIPAGIQNGQVIRVAGKGMPKVRRDGRGDLYLHAHIVVPKNLTEHQRQMLKRIKSQPVNMHE